MKKIFTGDVHFTEDFTLYTDVTVLGNFYANGNVHVNSLHVEGDIHLESSDINNPPCINTFCIHCKGKIFARNYIFKVDNLHAMKGREIINDGPVIEHTP